MERKWVIISALLHAAILLGVAVISRPVTNPFPMVLEVNLVSFPPGGSAIGDEAIKATGKNPYRDPMEDEAKQEPEPTSGHIGKDGPQSSELSVAKYESDMENTREDDSERTTTAVFEEIPVEPDDRINSMQDIGRAFSKDMVRGTDQQASPVYAGGLVSRLQTSNFKPQARLLAFSGDPSTIGGILTGGTGAGMLRPEILSLPEPVYPILSRKLGEEGRVILTVKISAVGGVLGAKVIESSSYVRLDQAALLAVKGAAFKPAVRYGVPVNSERKVAYTFRLEGR